MAMPPQQLTPTTWLLIAMTLLTKLLPYATLPPPATAPELRIFWPARNVTLPVATPNASAAPAPDGAHAAAPRCCVETGQCATASLLLRRLAPWLPLNASSTRAAAAATKPLLRGVRPVAAAGLGERLGIPSPDALAAGHKERLKTEVMNKFKAQIGKDEKKDDSAKDQMALWKQWMTIEDKASFGKDEWHCRKTPLPWMKQWHCLWDTAYWGPHGFLFGTNEESKKDATDLKTCARRPAADRPRAGRRPARAHAPARPPPRRRPPPRHGRRCHCYFRWFFERPAHIETSTDKDFRFVADKMQPADLEGRLTPGKNLFLHLFFGIMFGWLLALINTFLTGGTAPWITYHQALEKAVKAGGDMWSVVRGGRMPLGFGPFGSF